MVADSSTGEPVDPEAVAAFLSGDKGAVQLLIVVGGSGRRHSELEELLLVSRGGTLHKLLAKARDVGLLTKSYRASDDSEVYVLTPAGRAVYSRIQAIGLDQVFWQWKAQQDLYDDTKPSLVEWVENESAIFLLEAWHEQYLEHGTKPDWEPFNEDSKAPVDNLPSSELENDLKEIVARIRGVNDSSTDEQDESPSKSE